MAVATEDAVETRTLGLTTWLGFLTGQREAVVTVAGSRSAVWLGLLFVLSAGFAREYDGEYLLREPWHLLLPLGVSLATSLVLYALIYGAARLHGVKDLSWWSGYRTMLTFFWMTAPLAWLYAIPVERFLGPGDATAVNLLLLAVVSLWRVLLITRALSVWLDAGFASVLAIVLFFANSVLLVALAVTPTPIWHIMGGVRMPERESIILKVKMMTWIVGVPAWFLLALSAITAMFWNKSPWSLRRAPGELGLKTGWPLWLLAGLLLLAGFALLPLAQPEQQRRWEAEQLLRSGQYAEAIRYMSQVDRDAFPPHWDPPPRTSYGESEPPVEEIVWALNAAEPPQWLREIYLEKLVSSGDLPEILTGAVEDAVRDDPYRLEQLLSFLEQGPSFTVSRWARLDFERAAENEDLDPVLAERIRDYLGEP